MRQSRDKAGTAYEASARLAGPQGLLKSEEPAADSAVFFIEIHQSSEREGAGTSAGSWGSSREKGRGLDEQPLRTFPYVNPDFPSPRPHGHVPVHLAPVRVAWGGARVSPYSLPCRRKCKLRLQAPRWDAALGCSPWFSELPHSLPACLALRVTPTHQDPSVPRQWGRPYKGGIGEQRGALLESPTVGLPQRVPGTLHRAPVPSLGSRAVTPSSPPAFCPLPGNSAASVSRLAASQRCPETASSRQPPPRAPAPTPPRRRDPGLGTMCSVRKEGGLATLGGLRGPGKGPGAAASRTFLLPTAAENQVSPERNAPDGPREGQGASWCHTVSRGGERCAGARRGRSGWILVVPGSSLAIQGLRGLLSLSGSPRTPLHPRAATKQGQGGRKVSEASGVPKIRSGISEPGAGLERSSPEAGETEAQRGGPCPAAEGRGAAAGSGGLRQGHPSLSPRGHQVRAETGRSRWGRAA
ncbi:hypothetical protein NN561_000632 [Cricetulus griseus]